MTDEERRQVVWLRQEGWGYQAIAKQLGISRDTIRSFCRRNGLSGQRGTREAKLPSQRYCRECSRILIQPKGVKTKIFCSRQCREKWWKEHPEQINKKAVYSFVCAECGKAFIAYGNSKRKYCSHECYIRDRFGGGSRDE